jgi:hypothetical protein
VLKRLLNARTLLGVSVLVFGIATLIWHRTEAWLTVLAVALVVGGIALCVRRSAGIGAGLVGAVYAVFALTTVPGMIAKPDAWVQYVDFFEQLSVANGAVAIYALCAVPAARMPVLRQTTRIVLGICVVSFAWAQIVFLQHTASLVPAWLPPGQIFWTNVTTALFALAAIAILTNVRAQLAINLMVIMLALFGVIVWLPLLVTHPQSYAMWREISGNYAMTAAAWAVAGLLSPGATSVA